MHRIGIVILLAAAGFCSPFARAQSVPAATDPATEPAIHTEDVDRFFAIYDSNSGQPTAEQLQHDYIDAGSPGLKQFARVRNITGARIAETLAKSPQIYAHAKQCMAVLPRVRERVATALHELGQLYPQARFLPVTVAVGRGKPVGVGSPSTGIQIGLEALCATPWLNPDVEDRFVLVMAHEYVHVQQSPELAEKKEPTVLEASLIEGIAEFTAELIAGQVAYSSLTASTVGREKEIEKAFAADMDKTDLTDWLYNGTPDKPGDLGYWVGYRIAKAYYRHATDKRQALREILEMTNAKALLAKSGWYPGIELQ